MAASRPLPGPLVYTSILRMPWSTAVFAQSRAACVAANGVDFLDPLNPFAPPDDHTIVLPSWSDIVTIVLLLF
jgi:hypothetical protein